MHRLFVCISPDCLRVVNKSGIANHLKKSHRFSPTQLDQIHEKLSLSSFDAVDIENSSWTLTQEPVEAIQGIPVFNGYRCLGCKRSFGTSVSLFAHQRAVCRCLLKKPDNERFLRGFVQSVHLQGHAPFFPVFVPMLDPHTEDKQHAIQNFVVSHLEIKDDLTYTSPSDSRFNKTFLKVLGWTDYFADKNVSSILQLMKVSPDNEVYCPIFSASKQFFYHCLGLVKYGSFALLEKLGAGNK